MGYKHGGKGTRLYRIWKAMRSRCNNPNTLAYPRYGGRGIGVCKEWDDFSKFRAWAIANGYSDDLSIDRVDNDGGYSPDNCRWATRKEQNTNQRSNRMIEFHGERKTLTEWAALMGLSFTCVDDRLRRGWSVEKALTTHSNFKPSRLLVVNGVAKTITEWAREYGINDTTIHARLKAGWSAEDAVTKPVQRWGGDHSEV